MSIINRPPSVSQKEAIEYLNHIETKYNRAVHSLTITHDEDEDYVNLKYEFEPVNFVRIRRITGYLTGDTTSWNDAKTAELQDRTTHRMEEL